MSVLLTPYASALTACVVLAALILVQMLVMDFAGMRAKHIPGMPVTDGHKNFLFRATRAHGNTNENLGLFILTVLLAVFLGASTRWTNGLCWTFALARAGHMFFYYADLRLARSVAFGAGLLAQVGLIVVCAAAL